MLCKTTNVGHAFHTVSSNMEEMLNNYEWYIIMVHVTSHVDMPCDHVVQELGLRDGYRVL